MSYFVYYSINTIITVLLMLTMTVYSKGSGIFTRKRAGLFSACFAVAASTAILEWLGVYLDGVDASLKLVHTLVKAGELSLAPAVPALLALSIDGDSKSRWVLIMVAVNDVLEIISIFTQWVFYVDAGNIYRHGAIYPVYYLFMIGGYAYVMIVTYMVNRRNQRWRGSLLVILSTMMLLGAVPHILNTELRFDWLVDGILITLYYMYTTEVSAITDPLTGVFNRVIYEKRMSGRIKLNTVLVMFDVDNFKHINDSMGHAKGDEVLRLTAGVIREHYSHCGECYRVGGDEFCVVITRRAAFVDDMNEKFTQRLDELRQSNPLVPYVSLGCGIYTGTLEQVREQADANMYEFKRRRKAEREQSK